MMVNINSLHGGITPQLVTFLSSNGIDGGNIPPFSNLAIYYSPDNDSIKFNRFTIQFHSIADLSDNEFISCWTTINRIYVETTFTSPTQFCEKFLQPLNTAIIALQFGQFWIEVVPDEVIRKYAPACI